MAKAGVGRYAWLIPNTHSIVDFSSAAYSLIFNRGLCSDAKASSHSGNIKLGRNDQSRYELAAFLKSYDFSQVQIDAIIKRYLKILSSRVSTNLKPKLDYFVECGSSGSALHNLIVSNPYILQTGLNSFLKPRYEFLKTYLMDKVNTAIKRECMLLTEQHVETSVKYLEKQGVPVSRISTLLANHPRRLACGTSQLTKMMVEATKALGIEPSAPMFVWYIRVFGSMNETSWKKKVEVFKSLGWSDEDLRATLLHYPTCFGISEDKMRRNMGFYINNVKADPRDVIAQPILLQLSLNQTITPRYEVLKLLRQYNLFKSRRISTFFRASEKQFLTDYIAKNLDQVPHLLRVYHDSRKAKSDTPRSNP